jgi:hypothetical protein
MRLPLRQQAAWVYFPIGAKGHAKRGATSRSRMMLSLLLSQGLWPDH